MTKRLVVIDGKSVFYRGYYAMPGLSLKDGTPIGGVYGFVTLAIELIKKLEPDYVAVAWDKPKTNIRKRRELYPPYKANRKPAPADFYEQIPILQELLDAFGWPFYEVDDYEADDILGGFARQASEKGIETCLLTSDLDALQLVGPLTKVYALKNGLSNLEEFDIEYFESKYGIQVEQFLDLKSLKGDSSDNLPGVPGIGEKTAVGLLQEYGTLDNIYAHLDDIKPTVAKKLAAGKDSAYLCKEVGRIWTDVPVELDWGVADVNDTDLDKVAAILKRLEFHSLVNRLPQHMRHHDGGPVVAPRDQLPELQVTDWPSTIQFAHDQPVLVQLKDGQVLIAPDRQTYWQRPLADVPAAVWRALEFAPVVAFDAKAFYHAVAAQGMVLDVAQLHDVAVAAFLLDPLARDRSLHGVTGCETTDGPGRLLAELWRVYDEQLKEFAQLPRLHAIATELDFPLVRLLFQMEHRGILLDTTKMQQIADDLGTEITQLETSIYQLVGEAFNLNSPAQLSEVLFERLGLPTTGLKKVKSGFYSTDIKTLTKLQGVHPVIDELIKYREYAKLKGTYADTLPKQVDAQSRLHTTYNQDGAATGRLSSDSPNLQQIPTRSELGRKIKSAFVPSPGNVFVSADYSQFELRLAAVLAGDTQLIEDFNGDIDIHTKTASEVYGIPVEAVTKLQRRAAKVINFGVLYGMSPHGLSAATGMSFGEAKQFIDQYFALRAPIRQFIDATLEKATADGYVETFYGRRRPTPDVNSSNFMVREGAKRAAANMPIQGTEADLMKRAMLQVEQKLTGIGQQLLQIHDSILVECPTEQADKVATILQTTMEQVAPELPIRLKVDVAIGKNWGEL